MNACKKLLEAIFYNDNLLEVAEDMIAFSESALNLREPQKRVLARSFYQKLSSSIQEFLPPEAPPVYIAWSINAIHLLIWSLVPPYSSPEEFLLDIKRAGRSILEEYLPPWGKKLSLDDMIEIFDYMNDRFDFFRKVFQHKRTLFLLLNNSAKHVNSSYVPHPVNGEVPPHFIFLRVLPQVHALSTASPRLLLFHELGHALHLRFTGGEAVVPEPLLDFLADTGIINIKESAVSVQNDILADCLCMGFLLDSPFEHLDPFLQISRAQKEAYAALAEDLLWECR